jgi:glycerophosphoryl diester phosphodiesterase
MYHKKQILIILSYLLMLGFEGCEKSTIDPADIFTEILINTQSLPNATLEKMEGHYEVTDGSNFLGKQVICLVNNNVLSFITDKEGLYMVCHLGYKSTDTTLYLTGYFRDPLSSLKGFIKMEIKDPKSIVKIMSGNIDSNVVAAMTFLSGVDNSPKTSTLQFKRAFNHNGSKQDFTIIAHRGGGRNSDDLPYSENSIEMIKHATDFGATGVEIDIKLTSDLVPVIYHDDDINVRLTLKSPIIGQINQYRYKILTSFVRLIKGEQIPSLENTLDFIIDSTSLKTVWLDIKDSDEMFKKIVPLAENAKARAAAKNRNLAIYYGIPNNEVLASFKSIKDFKTLNSLCELEYEKCQEIGAKVWAPRWTLGIDKSTISNVQRNQVKVFTWTLDEEQLINRYITAYNYDGILTNYPSLVAYYYYSQYK